MKLTLTLAMGGVLLGTALADMAWDEKAFLSAVAAHIAETAPKGTAVATHAQGVSINAIVSAQGASDPIGTSSAPLDTFVSAEGTSAPVNVKTKPLSLIITIR